MNRMTYVALAGLLMLAGLVVMWNSGCWGSETADAFLRGAGGGMETGRFLIILQEQIETVRWMGALLAALGGYGLLRSFAPA